MRINVFFCLMFLMASCANSVSKVLKSPDPEYKLRMAEKYFAQKKYEKAQMIYEDVMPFFKGRNEFEDINYKFAFSAYNLYDYEQAEHYFKSFLELFPNSNKAEEVDYMRAYTFYKQSPKPELDQTKTIKAMNMMQIFINSHPGSERNKDAQVIIDNCKIKLEKKDHMAAQSYFDRELYRASAVAFEATLDAYPDSDEGDGYKLMALKSYYKFAENSVDDKKIERFEKVLKVYQEFVERFPESKLKPDAEGYLNLATDKIKFIKNEQTKTTT